MKEKMPKRTRRSYEQGAKEIRQATVRIKNGKPRVVDKTRKLSIAAVAEEAGMSEANIRNNYPEQADKIRGEKKSDLRQQRDHKQQQMMELREQLKDARAEIADLNRRLQLVTSRNATLEGLVDTLRKGPAKSSVTSFPGK